MRSGFIRPGWEGRGTERSWNAGFSLVELLTAMAVASVLVALALTIGNGFLAAWSRSSGRMSAQAVAQLVLDRVAADLEAADWRQDGKVWLIATVLERSDNSGLWTTAVIQKPNAVELRSQDSDALRFGQAGMWLRFFAHVDGANDETSDDTTARTLSAPTAVGYQLVRRPPGRDLRSTAARYGLNRSVVRSTQAGPRIGALQAGFDLDPAGESEAYRATGADVELGDAASIQRPQSLDDLLAEDVVDFGLRFYAREPDGTLRELFPIAESDREFRVRAASIASGTETSTPQTLDVFVRVLSSDGASLIAALEAGQLGMRPPQFASDAEWWWSIARANSELCSRRVELSRHYR